jgi:mannose-1-phosphate guanylyltransferase
MTDTAVIMAGGTGERFWPLGRKDRPKQLLKLTQSGKSLMQESIERALAVFEAENIYVITSSFLLGQIEEDLKDYQAINIIAEPAKRNTAPCLAFAASFIKTRYHLPSDQITMSVLTADHIISPLNNFADDLKACIAEASKGNSLLTIGIVPTYPATGFGYIKTSDKLSNDILKSDRFVEKPDRNTAKAYIDEGSYYWNSGMFCWRMDRLITEMNEHYPGAEIAIDAMTTAIDTNQSDILENAFCGLEAISIDYALMEKSDNVALKPSTFEWKDAGSLDILSELNDKDINSNTVIGDAGTILIDSKDNIISKSQDKKVALIGVDNMIVIDTGDALLICPKDRAQEVKKITRLLEN